MRWEGADNFWVDAVAREYGASDHIAFSPDNALGPQKAFSVAGPLGGLAMGPLVPVVTSAGAAGIASMAGVLRGRIQ